jgi:hypothetical protein
MFGRQREAGVPASVVEPGALVRRAFGDQSEQVVDGPLEPQRRRMMPGDRGKLPFGTGQADHRDVAALVIEQRQMDRGGFAPEPEHAEAPLGEAIGGEAPDRQVDPRTRPRLVLADETALTDEIAQR